MARAQTIVVEQAGYPTLMAALVAHARSGYVDRERSIPPTLWEAIDHGLDDVIERLPQNPWVYAISRGREPKA